MGKANLFGVRKFYALANPPGKYTYLHHIIIPIFSIYLIVVSFLQVFRATALELDFALAVCLAHKAQSNSSKEAWNWCWQDVEYNPFDVNFHIFRVKIYKSSITIGKRLFLRFKSSLIGLFVRAAYIQGTIFTKFEIKERRILFFQFLSEFHPLIILSISTFFFIQTFMNWGWVVSASTLRWWLLKTLLFYMEIAQCSFCVNNNVFCLSTILYSPMSL